MEALDSPFQPDDIDIQSRTTSHSGFLRIDTLRLRHRLFDGGWSDNMQRELLVRPPAVGVLLFDPVRDEIVLVRQFRIGVLDEDNDKWLLELVAGMVDPGEAPLEVARREAQEEADCSPADLVAIGEYYNSPGISSEKISLFCGRVDARSLGGVHGLAAEHEDIEVVVLSAETVYEAVRTGRINNAMTIIAVQWLQLHKATLLAGWSSPA
jgi:ADP-ribose pyrophosphatase